jgi:hypothetical protein
VRVTEALAGFVDLVTLESLEPARRHALVQVVGELLRRPHGAKLQHSSLYDKHVMARSAGECFEVV